MHPEGDRQKNYDQDQYQNLVHHLSRRFLQNRTGLLRISPQQAQHSRGGNEQQCRDKYQGQNLECHFASDGVLPQEDSLSKDRIERNGFVRSGFRNFSCSSLRASAGHGVTRCPLSRPEG